MEKICSCEESIHQAIIQIRRRDKDKQKLKDIMTTKLALQEILKWICGVESAEQK